MWSPASGPVEAAPDGDPARVVTWIGPAYRRRPNLVAPVRTVDGHDRVIKVCAANLDEYAGERDALQHYAARPATPGVRAVRLISADDRRQLLELERLDAPAAPAARLDAGWPDSRPDEDVTADLARAMRSLWARPARPADWRHLTSWMRALDTPSAVVPDRLRERARDLARELRLGADAEVVLHGDLHHENVFVRSDGALVVIDPKGIVGAPGFDVGALLWNPLGRVLDRPALMSARLDVLAATLPIPRTEIQAWGWVCCVLSAAWASEPKDAAYPLAVAELVRRG